MNSKVSITRRIDRKYYPVVFNPNGSVRPNVVKHKGQEIPMDGGCFYVSHYEGKRCIRESVGTSAAQAIARRDRIVKDLKAKAEGYIVPDAPVLEVRQNLQEAALEYLTEIATHKKPATYYVYKAAIEYFLESCDKTYIEDITRKDMLAYAAYLRDEKDHEPRSVFNRFSTVMGFLKTKGVKGLVRTEDWPDYTEAEPQTYHREELDKLFAVCDPEERVFFEFLLVTGFRKQEAENVEYSDVNFTDSTVTVRWKRSRGWQPKAYKERTVPLPAAMLEKLRERKGSNTGLIFNLPTPLRRLRAAAERAGLNPDDFWLHKFRASAATTYLQAGFDVKTVGAWLGHSDLASTSRYLSVAKGPGVRSKVDAIWNYA